MQSRSPTANKHNMIDTAVKNTSCDRGWVRVVVHTIFCTITVASFVLILVMSIQRSPTQPKRDSGNSSRCFSAHCRIVCSQAPYNGQFEMDIIETISKAQVDCQSMILTLNRPEFYEATLPVNWLSGVSANIVKLDIVGGNLKWIPPGAFMSTFTKHVKTLNLEHITITGWEPDMLIGLISLQELYFRDCRFGNIYRNALRTVDETLQRLHIKTSGTWDPRNITGSSELIRLTDVDLSLNRFGDILGRHSFIELTHCETLRLSSSFITSIRGGAFDFLLNIKTIHLNNNRLKILPAELFNRITSAALPTSMIDLQDNLWDCSCHLENIRTLNENGFLIMDPVCHSPKAFRGKHFSQFKSFCSNNASQISTESKNINSTENYNTIEVSSSCSRNKTQFFINYYTCARNNWKFNLDNLLATRNQVQFTEGIKPSYLIKNNDYSMIEIDLYSTVQTGLLWFRSTCPDVIYCVETLPKHLRIYDIDLNDYYTICHVFDEGVIRPDSCIMFNPTETSGILVFYRVKILLFITAIFGGGGVGAIVLYSLIRKNPALLKGSKRVLIVKHKIADAVVLPPDIPARNFMLKEKQFGKDNIYFIPTSNNLTPMVSSTGTVKSYSSGTPSYVSAIQPTEEQFGRLAHGTKYARGIDIDHVAPVSSLFLDL